MRSESQKVVGMTMEKDFHEAIKVRATALNLSVSAYIRTLVQNDLRTGGDLVLLAQKKSVLPPASPDQAPSVDETARILAQKAAQDAVEKVRERKKSAN